MSIHTPSRSPAPAKQPSSTRLQQLSNEYKIAKPRTEDEIQKSEFDRENERAQEKGEIEKTLENGTLISSFGHFETSERKQPDPPQDSIVHRVYSKGSVFGSYDGVSAAPHSEIGSYEASRLLADLFDEEFFDELSRQQEKESYVEKTAEQYLKTASEIVGENSTTCSAGIVWMNENEEPKLTIAHSGDSSMFLWHENTLQPLTVEASEAAATGRTIKLIENLLQTEPPGSPRSLKAQEVLDDLKPEFKKSLGSQAIWQCLGKASNVKYNKGTGKIHRGDPSLGKSTIVKDFTIGTPQDITNGAYVNIATYDLPTDGKPFTLLTTTDFITDNTIPKGSWPKDTSQIEDILKNTTDPQVLVTSLMDRAKKNISKPGFRKNFKGPDDIGIVAQTFTPPPPKPAPKTPAPEPIRIFAPHIQKQNVIRALRGLEQHANDRGFTTHTQQEEYLSGIIQDIVKSEMQSDKTPNTPATLKISKTESEQLLDSELEQLFPEKDQITQSIKKAAKGKLLQELTSKLPTKNFTRTYLVILNELNKLKEKQQEEQILTTEEDDQIVILEEFKNRYFSKLQEHIQNL